MTAEEFAKKNAGQIVKASTSLDAALFSSYKSRGYTSGIALGIVVGYGATNVYIEPSQVANKIFGKSIVNKFYSVIPGYDKSKPTLRFSKYKDLVIGGSLEQNPTPGVQANKHIPEYPHKCQFCNSPAYIGANLIDCSNTKCSQKYKSKSALDLFSF